MSRLLFVTRFVTLASLIGAGVGAMGWGAARLMNTEDDALTWAVALQDRMAAGRGKAENLAAREDSAYLAEVLRQSMALGGDDLPQRAANLQALNATLASRQELTDMPRLAGRTTALTFWVNPATGQGTALNGTADGRIDPAAVTRIKASTDPRLVVSLARERAAQNAPLTPAERVQLDLARLKP